MSDLLKIGAKLMLSQAEKSEGQKLKEAEWAREVQEQLRRSWETLVGEHKQAIRKACDVAKLDYGVAGHGLEDCVMILRRGRKTARIDVDCLTPAGPYWRPVGWKVWSGPNPDALALYIWSALYSEEDQRIAVNELSQSLTVNGS